jgi:hypothetical protein
VAFSETLAARVRECVAADEGVVEKRMFGGLAFLVRGHMSHGPCDEGLALGLLGRTDA